MIKLIIVQRNKGKERLSVIKTLTGNLVIEDGQNLIYCVWFGENVQKPFKEADSRKCANFDCFRTIYLYGEIAYFF